MLRDWGRVYLSILDDDLRPYGTVEHFWVENLERREFARVPRLGISPIVGAELIPRDVDPEESLVLVGLVVVEVALHVVIQIQEALGRFDSHTRGSSDRHIGVWSAREPAVRGLAVSELPRLARVVFERNGDLESGAENS